MTGLGFFLLQVTVLRVPLLLFSRFVFDLPPNTETKSRTALQTVHADRRYVYQLVSPRLYVQTGLCLDCHFP